MAAVPSAPTTAPVVGLSTYAEHARFGNWEVDAVLLHREYPDVVAAAGGVPVLLPPLPATAARAVDVLDALVVTGGHDVDPRHYGAERHPRTEPPRPDRDAAELAALHRALDRGIPVLGICRGAQLLNVALGGTLHQHVPDITGRPHNPRPGVFGVTDVTTEPGSRVGTALGPRTQVHCHHHQAIDRLGDGLVVTARAGDGVVEAVELACDGFVVGVQWHPERVGEDLRLVAALVAAAGRPSRV